MYVRPAEKSDLPAIEELVNDTAIHAYAGVMPRRLIAAAVEDRAAPSELRRALLSGSLMVAVDRQMLTGFALANRQEGFLHITAFSAPCLDPGACAGLIAAVQELAPDQPIAVDIVLDDRNAESVMERAGFVPGEIMPSSYGTETLVHRRWWRTGSG